MKLLQRILKINRIHSNVRYSSHGVTNNNEKNQQTTSFDSVDLNEVKHFQSLSDNWWNSTGEMHILHNMNKLRVPFIRDGITNTGLGNPELRETDKPLKGVKILDVGCGGGFLTEPLARLGAQTVGIDATKPLIEVATNHMKKDKSLKDLSYVHTTIEEFAVYNRESFDAVVTSEVIEHIITKQNFIADCVRCIKPGGSIFVTTLNQTLASKILAIFMAENILNIVPKGTHEYEKFITPHNLQRILEDCNCSTRRIHGLMLNPLSSEWSWVPFTDINYALHAVKYE